MVPGPETETLPTPGDLLRPTFFSTFICGLSKWSVCQNKVDGLADIEVQNTRWPPS